MSPGGDQGGIPTVVNASTGSEAPPHSPGVPPMSPPGDGGGASVGDGSPQVPGLPRRYRIRRKIDCGGYGCVYEAHDRLLRIDVAIKVINRAAGALGGSSGAGTRRAILSEAQKLARVGAFPGIVRLHTAEFFRDPGTGDRRLYLVMDLVREGKGLVRYAEEKNLDREQRIDLFIRVCDAVHFLHQIGIVHRDLKPANILIGRSAGESEDRPHIIDFGIARQTGVAVDERRGVEGTLAYMSPEQTKANANLTPASDVYSLGVILYLLLCGRLPYSVDKLILDEAFRLIRTERPDLDSSPARHLPDDLRAILMRSMNKTTPGQTGSLDDGDPRYADAGCLAAALRRYRRGEPVGPLPWPVGATRWVRRGLARPLVGLVAAMVLSFLVADKVVAPLAYRWTPLSAWFQSKVVKPVERLDDVVVVSVDRNRVTLPDTDGTGGMRSVLADVVTKVAGSLPRAIVLDLYFREDPRVGGAWAQGPMGSAEREALDRRTRLLRSALRGASDAGGGRRRIPMLVGTERWDLDDSGRLRPMALTPMLEELTRERPPVVRVGEVAAYVTTKENPKADWKLPLLVEQAEHNCLPSLSLQAVAAALQPDHLPKYTIEAESDTVIVDFFPAATDPQAVVMKIDPALRRAFRVTQVLREQGEATTVGTSDAKSADKHTAWLVVLHPDPRVIAVATVSASDILAGDTRALERCRDKIVLIVDAEETSELTPLGDKRPRWHSHALAIQSMLRGSIKYPSANEEVLITLAGGLLGWFVVRPIGRRYSWWPRWWVAARWGVWALAALVVVVAAAWLARASSYVITPAIPLGAALVAGAVGLVAGEARRRPLVEEST